MMQNGSFQPPCSVVSIEHMEPTMRHELCCRIYRDQEMAHVGVLRQARKILKLALCDVIEWMPRKRAGARQAVENLLHSFIGGSRSRPRCERSLGSFRGCRNGRIAG